VGDQFDGAGFVRGVQRKGFDLSGKRGPHGGRRRGRLRDRRIAGRRRSRRIGIFDSNEVAVAGLAKRINEHYPQIEVITGSKDPDGYDIVVNATPLGMNDGRPAAHGRGPDRSLHVRREVVMKQEITPFLRAAQEKGCRIQVGKDMLFEQIPAYLEFFGFGSATADELRAVAQIKE
jgi:shikimate dehydrogenase